MPLKNYYRNELLPWRLVVNKIVIRKAHIYSVIIQRMFRLRISNSGLIIRQTNQSSNQDI